MLYILDKVVLILVSFAMLMREGKGADYVVVFLLGLLFACANTLLTEYEYGDKDRLIFDIGMGVFCMLAFGMTGIIYMAPAIVYDAFLNSSYFLGIALTVIVVIKIIMMDAGFLLGMILFGLIIVAILLQYKSRRQYELEHTMRKIRDDSEEKNLLLAEKNKNLIEKQDQDIYVATLKERNRIAREIHDNVGHIITRTILQMGALMTINKEEPLHGQLKSVKDNLDVAMNNIRESVHDLHDESVDLSQAIKDIVSALEGRFICNLDYDISNNVDKNYKYVIIGIVKEAVSNIIKHSKNDMVDIILREHPAMYQIVIHDYCKTRTDGIDKISISGMGIGLHNIRDRVDSLGGQINIVTNNGFKIFVTLPKN